MKNLMADKKSLEEGLRSATKDSLKAIIGESVENSMRQILAEAKDEPDVEEVVTDEEGTFEELPGTEAGSEAEGEEEAKGEGDEGGAGTEDGETEEISIPDDADDVKGGEDTVENGDDADDEDMWNELEQYKNEDGEYDLTSLDKDDAIKVLKVMNPEDGVRVVKNDNGSLTLTDDETEKEYIIDLEGDFEGEGKGEEVAAAEIDINEGEANLGYTTEYQGKTAMTMDDDDNAESRFDKGAPKGNGRRWVGTKGANGGNPYSQKVNEMDNECGDEENIFEVELECADECGIKEQSRFGKANERGMHKTMKGGEDTTTYGSHAVSRRGEYRGCETGMTNEEAANIKRKANAIFMENKELRKIADQFREKLNEAVLINASLAKVVKIVTENTTTRDEKIAIVSRFNNVKSLNECRDLYEKISGELKSAHAINNTSNVINSQLTEGRQTPKQSITETTLLQSNDLNETLDLMKRVESIR